MNPEDPINIGIQICQLAKVVGDLLERVESLEHYSNQSSILVDTLGDIMEEMKRLEP